MGHVLRLADIDDLSGMTLAEAVTDSYGHVLVPAGAELTASLLVSLKRRDVVEVCVDEPAASNADTARSHDDVRRRLDTLFRASGASGTGAALMQRMLAYRTGS